MMRVVEDFIRKEPSMEQITRIGMDTSKRIFQVHCVDVSERVVLRRQLRRSEVIVFFKRLPPALVAIEACGAAHYWARELGALGHDVKLIAPQLAKPYVKRGKNDAADAQALCEAASRPTMRFVAAKSQEQQAALMLAGQRERLVRQRTQLTNTIRGHAAEFGLIAAKGPAQVEPLLRRLQTADVPALARDLFAELADEYAMLGARIADMDARLMRWHKNSEMARRLTAIPGVGPLIASLLVMKTPDPHAFRSGRDFAAWLGLTPRDHSTAGKARPGRITRAGDAMLRSLLVVGATAVIWQTRRGAARHPSPWVEALLERKPPKLVAVALANKIARIAWKLMTSGESCRRSHALPALTAAA
jgi:transposase